MKVKKKRHFSHSHKNSLTGVLLDCILGLITSQKMSSFESFFVAFKEMLESESNIRPTFVSSRSFGSIDDKGTFL